MTSTPAPIPEDLMRVHELRREVRRLRDVEQARSGLQSALTHALQVIREAYERTHDEGLERFLREIGTSEQEPA